MVAASKTLVSEVCGKEHETVGMGVVTSESCDDKRRSICFYYFLPATHQHTGSIPVLKLALRGSVRIYAERWIGLAVLCVSEGMSTNNS